MRVIAVANQKGGCGKTTVCINLSACLAQEGQRTLIVDLDPQGHCALGLAVPEEQIEASVATVLDADLAVESPDLGRVIWQISSNFDLIPSKMDLSKLERRLANVEGREQRLREALDRIRDRYDFIIIDTPPTIGFLTESALYAADEVIVPVDTGYFSLHGLTKQLETIRHLRDTWNKALTTRIVANHYDVRTKLGREILVELRKRHGDAMFTSFINFNTKLKESSSLGQPITEYEPASTGCRDFVRLARELVAIGAGTVAAEPSINAPVVVRETGFTSGGGTSQEKQLLQRADALAADADKLLATTETLIGGSRNGGRAGTSFRSSSLPPSTPEDTARKIEKIYGPQPSDDGVVFVVRASGARQVQVAGSFNDWNPGRTPMQHVDRDTFQIRVPLRPGRHLYRYVVDGQWRNDPANHAVELNPYGELNNVVEVAAPATVSLGGR
jgi:chromosome partitioning protein